MAKGGCMVKGVCMVNGCVCGEGGGCMVCTPPMRYDRSMRGRYASYWNAFLFFTKVEFQYQGKWSRLNNQAT